MTIGRPSVRQITQSAARRRPARTGSRTSIAPRIAILPYSFSDSATALKNGIVDAGPVCTKLRIPQSAFRGRPGDLVVNWGNSTIEASHLASVVGQGRIFNAPENIRQASDKIRSFRAMQDAEVSTVEWTVDRGVAMDWFNEGCLVYARTRLSGHSGEGIVMVHQDPESIEGVGEAFSVQSVLPQARLYTKGLTEQRREFRIHVMNGVVINVQQKKRADGWRENAAYSNVVRNYHTGWIYANGDISPNEAAISNAVNAVSACGLDFGAVDVITRRDEAWVLEVNTAPGLQGSNLDAYVENIVNVFLHQPLTAWEPEVTTDDSPNTGADRVSPEPIPERTRQVELPRRAPTIPNPSPRTPDTNGREPTQAAPAPQSVVLVRDAGFYRAEVRGVGTIVQYNVEVNGFYMPGWEIPMSQGDEGFIVHLDQEITV
ncbi:MAG: ATP-grasp domain-containing protein [Bacteroidales bacterium]